MKKNTRRNRTMIAVLTEKDTEQTDGFCRNIAFCAKLQKRFPPFNLSTIKPRIVAAHLKNVGKRKRLNAKRLQLFIPVSLPSWMEQCKFEPFSRRITKDSSSQSAWAKNFLWQFCFAFVR